MQIPFTGGVMVSDVPLWVWMNLAWVLAGFGIFAGVLVRRRANKKDPVSNALFKKYEGSLNGWPRS